MDEHEAVARVRAADPAAGAEPDAERLARITAERRADELAPRRSPRWLAVAAVTAGALLIGGAGFGLGRATEDTAQPTSGPAIGTPEIAAPDRGGAAESMASADIAYPGGHGPRTTFTAQGLSTEAGSAAAWAFDGAATYSAETATRAAEVFGLDGEPREQGGWVVGADDGPRLQLAPDGTSMLSYHDPELYTTLEDVVPAPMPEPDGAGEGAPGRAGGGTSGSSGEEPARAPSGDGAAEPEPPADVPAAEPTAVEPVPAQPLPAPGGPGEEPGAVQPDGQAPDGPAGALYDTLAALGLDPEAAEYATQQHWSGDEVTSVVAHQLIDGTRTGQSWRADVVDGEVLSFNGPLAPLADLGEYAVVSPAEAVERLADPRFGGTQVWSGSDGQPMQPSQPERDWDDPPGEPPAPGEAIEWPVTDVTIGEAVPALTQHRTSEGSVLLLPAYELSDAEGRTWRVLAVADQELAF